MVEQSVIIPCVTAGRVEEQQIKSEHHGGPGSLRGLPQAQPQRPGGELPSPGGSRQSVRAWRVLCSGQPVPALLRPPNLSAAQPGGGGEHGLAAGAAGQSRHPLPPADLPRVLLSPAEGGRELWLPPGCCD